MTIITVQAGDRKVSIEHTDAIAVLSGVNYTSVLKVLQAVAYLQERSQHSLDEIVDTESVKPSPALTRETIDHARMDQGDQLVDLALSDGFDMDYPKLRLRERSVTRAKYSLG